MNFITHADLKDKQFLCARLLRCDDKIPLPRRKRRQPERAIQRAVVDHLAWRAPADTWWTHFPAGGRRSRVTGALLKGMGTKPGVPDLLIVSRGKLFGLELKADRGRLSDTQRQCHSNLREAGATIGVAGSVDEALDILGEWGILGCAQ